MIMPQGKATKKMTDFLNIFNLRTQQLICVITYQKFQGEWEVSYPRSI